MASSKSKGRRPKQRIGRPMTSVGSSSTAAKGGGFAGKPVKSSTTGNYGKAVSTAAKAKSAAPATAGSPAAGSQAANRPAKAIAAKVAGMVNKPAAIKPVEPKRKPLQR